MIAWPTRENARDPDTARLRALLPTQRLLVPFELADDARQAQPLARPARGWRFAASDVAPKTAGAHVIPIPLRWLAGNRTDEGWFEGSEIVRETRDDLTFFVTDNLLCGLLDLAEQGPLEPAIATAYRQIHDGCAGRGFPHLLRYWNFFGAINDGSGDDERYRRFCVGRAQVQSLVPASDYPAATAIGIPGSPGRLQIAFLAARRAGEAIENPRQTHAWNYPREFGPAAPGFSRAMLLPWLPEPLLLVSGTASVVGHATVHGSTANQLEEALRNVDTLIVAAATRLDQPLALGAGSALRVYLRDAEEAPAVALQLRERLPSGVDWMILQGDICRTDLRIELELRQSFTAVR